MRIVELFKYNSLISIPLFLAVALTLMRTAQGHSYKLHTISKAVQFYPGNTVRRFFNGNFILKALLDYGFLVYLVAYAGLTWNSVPALLLFAAITMFGLLAFFTEETNSFVHVILAYAVGTVWSAVELLLAYRTGSIPFIIFTYPMAILPTGIAYFYLFRNNLNVYLQLVVALLIEMWLIAYVLIFL